MKIRVFLLLLGMQFLIRSASADQVKVRYAEGLARGFLIVRQEDGKQIADGDASQVERDGHVTNHVIFRFKDGSIYEDTTVFTQRGTFHLVSDHVIQKGPSFKTPIDSSIDAATGLVTVRYQDGGKEKVSTTRLRLPRDVANGLIFTLIKNVKPNVITTVSYVGMTPKPRLVKLVFTPEQEEKFATGGLTQAATHYLMRAHIGGVVGAVTPLLGKHPADTQIWVIGGEAPIFAGSEGPLYADGPVWRIELVSPVRKDISAATGSQK
jgi:hypothetical protein